MGVPTTALVLIQLFTPVTDAALLSSINAGRPVPEMMLSESSAFICVASALETWTNAALPPLPTNVL